VCHGVGAGEGLAVTVAQVRLFAAAAEACDVREVSLPALTVGELVAALGALGDDAPRVLRQCAVLVNGVRRDDAKAALAADALVDVLPPFAGG